MRSRENGPALDCRRSAGSFVFHSNRGTQRGDIHEADVHGRAVHCGAVRYEADVDLSKGDAEVQLARSAARREPWLGGRGRGATSGLLRGAEALSEYQFGRQPHPSSVLQPLRGSNPLRAGDGPEGKPVRRCCGELS